MEALQRVKAIYVELAQRPDLRDGHVPLSDWAAADQGLTIEQQWAVAFAAFGRARVLDDEASPLERGALAPDFVAQFAAAAKVPESSVEGALVGDRSWYRERFARGVDDYQQALWNRVPFERRPSCGFVTGDCSSLPRARC